jgi:hypothetical protein
MEEHLADRLAICGVDGPRLLKDRRAEVPSDGIALPRVCRPEVAMALPTTAQVRALLAVAPDEWGTFVAL